MSVASRLGEKMHSLLKNETTVITGGTRCACTTHDNVLIKKLIVASAEDCYLQCCTGYDHAPSFIFETNPNRGLRGSCPRLLWLYEDAGLTVWDDETAP